MKNDILKHELLETFRPLSIGFDNFIQDTLDMFKTHNMQMQTYPPYNIVKIDNDNYLLELALAGFKSEDLNIEINERNVLIISSKQKEQEQKQFIYKGIGQRNFIKYFALADSLEIIECKLTEGVLRIFLRNKTPELKTKKIKIG